MTAFPKESSAGLACWLYDNAIPCVHVDDDRRAYGRKKIVELDRLAESLDRNRNWVINKALASYLEVQRWQIDEIKQGIADTEAGRTYSTEEVLERIARLEAQQKAPRRKRK